MNYDGIDMFRRERIAEIKGKVTLLFALAVVGVFISHIPMIVYAVILLGMKNVSDYYKTAGICFLVSSVTGTVSWLFFGDSNMILSLFSAIFALAAVYSEIQGHAEVMAFIDAGQSTKWEKLWHWMIIAYGILIGSILLVLIIPVIGVIAAAAGAIAIFVTSIMKIVYLYRMDNAIKNLV